jgi:hypothetical protein
MDADALAVADGDARRLLPAVLEREEPEVSQVGYLDLPAMDSKDAAHASAP